MEKPKEILELEKKWGVKFKEVKDVNFLMKEDTQGAFFVIYEGTQYLYLLSENGKIIGLRIIVSIEYTPLDLSFLYSFKDLEYFYLMLPISQGEDFTPLSGVSKLKQIVLRGVQFDDLTLFSNLHNLEYLDLYNNRISNKKEIEGLVSLKYLNLFSTMFSDVNSLSRLVKLEVLMLGRNGIQEIAVVKNFTKVYILDLRFNEIEDISVLKHLKKMQSVWLGGNKIYDISSLQKLQYLNKLDLSHNQIKDIRALQKLQLLEYLTLGKNKIQDITPLEGLSNLQILDLYFNEIEDISALGHSFLLKRLNLSDNKIAKIDDLEDLTNLEDLSLAGNKIKDISALKKLTKLKFLNASNNQIQDISVLNNLSQLKSINIGKNKINNLTISFLDRFKDLERLELYNNPIQNIPKEVFDKGNKNVLIEVRDFLENQEKGSSKNKEVKIILIGNGSVGKTQIAKRLAEKENYVYDSQHNSTHGIVLLQRELKDLTLNIWDFAGQDIYHTTHRLFMQTRALFVLVWDVDNEWQEYHEHKGKQYKNEKLSYWLEYAKCFGQGSPILVVQNKVDSQEEEERRNLEKIEAHYKEHFPIIEFVQCSAKTGYNFDVLEYWLGESFKIDEGLKTALNIDFPTSWLEVRNQIQTIQKQGNKTMTLSDFKSLCEQTNIAKSTNTLLQYLHDSSFFYYKSGYFGDKIILDQGWAIDAIYKVLDRSGFYYRMGKLKNGILKYEGLQALWKDNTDSERELFIGFMLSAELCFEMEESQLSTLQEKTFVVPQLLAESTPPEIDFWKGQYQLNTYHEVISYRFLPTVFIHRFIVRAHRFSRVENMWQHGLLLEWKTSQALIYADYTHTQICIESNNEFLIQKIKEELEIISGEGKIRAQTLENEQDVIYLNDKYIRGLAALQPIHQKTQQNPMMELTGQQIGQFRDALMAAFLDYDSFKMMLHIRLNKSLAALVGSGPLQNVAYDLIIKANAEGWAKELLDAARADKPGNKHLKVFEDAIFGKVVEPIEKPIPPKVESPNPDKKAIRMLIAASKVEEALNHIQAVWPDNNEVILLSGRFARLKRDSNLGTISHENYTLEYNKIVNSILAVLDGL